MSPASSFCLRNWGAEDRWTNHAEGTREYTRRVITDSADWDHLTPLDPQQGMLDLTLGALHQVFDALPDGYKLAVDRSALLAQSEFLSLHLSLTPETRGIVTTVDVFEVEPVLDAAHPLLQLPNVLATPHLGYVERDTYELYFGQAFEAVVNWAQDRPIPVLNPSAGN